MKNEKNGLFGKVEFENAAYAKDVVDTAAEKVEKCKRGILVGLASTVGWIMFLALEQISPGLACLGALIGVVGAIAAYVIGGGLGKAFSVAFKMAKFGWFIIPVFPVDVFVGITAFCVVAWLFCCVPSLFVFVNMRQISKEKAEAEEYLKYCN